jgi:hypothetical protein
MNSRPFFAFVILSEVVVRDSRTTMQSKDLYLLD